MTICIGPVGIFAAASAVVAAIGGGYLTFKFESGRWATVPPIAWAYNVWAVEWIAFMVLTRYL